MRIGELARRSGLSTSRIRFYEAKGLLTAVSRKSNGYRQYPADALTVLGVIVGAQRTGFSLNEIRQVLPADVGKWRHRELLGALRRKVADIEQMEQRLGQSRRQQLGESIVIPFDQIADTLILPGQHLVGARRRRLPSAQEQRGGAQSIHNHSCLHPLGQISSRRGTRKSKRRWRHRLWQPPRPHPADP